jgi:pantoate--beta-alanine ligase
MKIINSISQMQALSQRLKRQNKTIGFVPTMGYFHEGHLSLMRKARMENDFLVVSIFVNPTQFGPKEDFSRYPRDLKHDKKLAKRENVDCIFYPKAEDIYPLGYKTHVYVEDLSQRLCGISRPHHFKGVTTIVAKLLNIVGPDVVYFGQKDAQQAIIIERMIKDLNFPLKIKVLPTVREKDGLAMSSRNKYLSPRERKEALVLSASLGKARSLLKKGERNPTRLKRAIARMINSKKTAKLEYIEIVDTNDLKPLKEIKGKVLIAIACRFGKARLIDNIMVNVK